MLILVFIRLSHFGPSSKVLQISSRNIDFKKQCSFLIPIGWSIMHILGIAQFLEDPCWNALPSYSKAELHPDIEFLCFLHLMFQCVQLRGHQCNHSCTRGHQNDDESTCLLSNHSITSGSPKWTLKSASLIPVGKVNQADQWFFLEWHFISKYRSIYTKIS